MSASMGHAFTNRDDLIDYLRQQFPQAYERGSEVSPLRGGYAAAQERLRHIQPALYASTRNHVDGAVTRLSPYIRHGVLSLAEVRDFVLQQASAPGEATKLLNELAWRDYWQRLYTHLGEAINSDLEPDKTGIPATERTNTLPADIAASRTGLACMDAFSTELRKSGYLHNHARMWLAAYIVHWRRVTWQAGAAWFLEHLLDGDPASNHLSWQWVASTFSQKPYIFNRENLERYTHGQYCQNCPMRGRCDFEGTYEQLEQRLFPPRHLLPSSPAAPTAGLTTLPATTPAPNPPITHPVIWIHGDCLSPSALRRFPSAPAIWVWDDELLQQWRISFKRIVFIYECLLELPVTIQRGLPAKELLRFAEEHHADAILTTPSPSPRYTAILQQIKPRYSVIEKTSLPFLQYSGALDLRRFSRYWQIAQKQVIQPTSLSNEV